MNRTDKTAFVEELSARFRETPNIFLTTFSGLTVGQETDLRRQVGAAGGTYRVVKNRLTRRAAAGTPVEPLTESLVGPRSMAFHHSDPLALAKVLVEFAEDNPELKVLGGLIDAKDLLDADAVKSLAKLPSLPELQAQLLSVIQMPATMLTRLIGTPATQLAAVIKARNDRMESDD